MYYICDYFSRYHFLSLSSTAFAMHLGMRAATRLSILWYNSSGHSHCLSDIAFVAGPRPCIALYFRGKALQLKDIGSTHFVFLGAFEFTSTLLLIALPVKTLPLKCSFRGAVATCLSAVAIARQMLQATQKEQVFGLVPHLLFQPHYHRRQHHHHHQGPFRAS